MRKANFKTLVVAGLAAFILLLGAGGVSAQTSLSDLEKFYEAPQGTFVTPVQAEVILENHCTALRTFVQTLLPGSPAYKTTVRAIGFYRQILGSVLQGETVPEAIATGTYLFTTAPYGEATYLERTGLKQDVIGMLSQ